ncbi:MAG: hypothetical protein NTX50_32050 [Candidatus Sumerlaeota bacterium]|nr:hypothetical protein [Candidatus Sumerlaeota bacterium]
MDTRLDPVTLKALQAFGRRRRRLIAWRGVCAVIATALAAMSVVAFMDFLFLLSDAVRLGLSFCAYIAVFAVFWMACLRWLMHQPDLRELAAMFEQRHAQLREEILSAVELGDDRKLEVWDSEEFRSVIQRDVASRVQSLKVVQLLPGAMIRRWIIIAGAAAAVCLLLAALPGLRFGMLIARAFAPTANLERVSRTSINVLQPLNPDQLFARGDPLTVEVEVTGKEPSEVRLETFVKGTKTNVARMAPQGSQRYTAIFAANEDSQAFRVLAGDAVSRRYTIQTRRRPHVATFHKTYRFPEYSNLKAHEVTEPAGDLEALEGSTADLVLEVDQPVSEAELRIETLLTGKARKDAPAGENMKKETVKLSVVDPSHLQGTIPMKVSGSYTVYMVAKDTKFENKFSPSYKISALPDLTPSVLLQKPVANTVVTADQTVTLEGEAVDDLALKKVSQMTRVNNGPWQETILAETPGAELKISKFWDLLSLRAKPGDQIWTKLVAIDLKGSRSETPPLKMTVSSANFNPARIEKMAGKRTLMEALKTLAGSTEQLIHQARAAVEEAGKGSGDAAKRKMAVAAAQARAQAVDDAAEAAWKALLETAKRAEIGRESQELSLLSRLLSRLRREALVKAQIYLRNAEEPGGSIKEQVGVAADASGGVNDLANRARNAYTEWLAAAEADSIAQDLRRLIKNQEQMTQAAGAKQAPAWDQLARQEEAATREQMLTEGMLNHLAGLMPQWQEKSIKKYREALETARLEMEKSLEESKPDRWLADAGRKLQESLAAQEDAFKKTRYSIESNAINNAENVARSLARTADDVEQVRNAAYDLMDSEKKIQALRKAGESEARKLAEESRRSQKAAEAIENRSRSAMAQLRDRAQMEEALGVHDPLFIADNSNAAAALGAVVQSGADPAQREKATKNLQELTKAYRALELGHDWVSAKSQLGVMADKEQSKDPRKSPLLRTPGEWRQLELQIKVGQGQLDPSGMPKEVKKELSDVVSGRDMKVAHEELDKRHKDQTVTQSVAPQLSNLGQSVGGVLTLADKTLQDARALIASLSPSLAEQLKAIEKMAKETMEKTQETAKQTEQAKPEDARKETHQALEKQENVNTRLETATDAIRHDANLQDLATKDGRERARDADDALAMLRQPPPKAKDLLNQAADSPEAQAQKEARKDLLDKAVDQQKQLDDALKTIAQHYENLEKGNADDTRQALRKAEEQLGIQQAMNDQYKQAERLAELAAKSPEELKPALEKELKTNQPMREELGEIADKAVADAINALQQTVRQEDDIAANLQQIAEQPASRKADQARQNAEQIKADAARQNDLKPPVQDAAAGLERAAKEAEQLSRADAEALKKSGEATQQLANNELTKAEQAMAQADKAQPPNNDAQAQAKQADQAKQAQAPVENARDAAASQMANLSKAQDQAAQDAAQQPQNQPPVPAQQADTPQAMANSAVNAAAQWMARALDQLNGAPPAADQAAQPNADPGQQQPGQQPQPANQQAQNGQNPQQNGQNAQQNAAQQSLKQGLQSEQQAMAQARAAMAMASQNANKSANGITDILSKRGTGVMPDAVALKKAEWGKLRGRETRDMIEAREDSVSEEYRGMVGAYFKAIAEKSKEQK